MRVLVVHNRYRSDLPSGENEVVDAEVEALRRRDVDVRTYLRSSDEIPDLPLRERAGLPLRPLFSRRDVRAVEAVIEQWRPDVLHLHNPYPLISPAVITAAGRAGVATVQTVHNFRHVCMSGLHFREGRACVECRDAGSPRPGVAHGCYRGSRAQSVVMAAALVRHRSTFAGLDRWIALTDHVAEHLVGYGADPSRVVVKPNTVADPGPAAGAGAGFVFVGRLSEEKGLRLLLDAWSRHPDGALGTLTVVGDGPERPALETAAADRADIVVAGQVSSDRAREAMRAAGVVVVPSVWAEVFPRVVVEAMAAGRGVLVTRTGALPRIVADGGWSAPLEPVGFAETLTTAAAADVVAVGRAARARYEGHYSPDIVHARLVGIYEEAVAERRSRRAVAV